jgi:hypothetical protein
MVMAKWMKDGLIGWGAVVIVGIVTSLVTNAPYSFLSTVLYMLLIGLFAVPGAILLGRNRSGWILPLVGGFISAAIIYYILAAITGYV